MVSWKLLMCNTEQMVFLNIKLPTKQTHINISRDTWWTHFNHSYTFINNYSDCCIHRQICKVFPAGCCQSSKVRLWKQVKVSLMWKTDGAVSQNLPSYSKKMNLFSLLHDSKGSALTFNSKWTGPDSIHVRLRSCWLDALCRCCRQWFAHSVLSCTHWPA